ncbi:4Fe-4S dicluster domain-containing protein [Actinomadura nitritigenes]|uniref:4Fe-4S dicluster domain-containing protein n=1 Tax=Actinomadura nitritigenes TaxID=134602 RepID=UPI003D8DC353
MIEVVSAARCVKCDICVKVCPTDVFDRGPDGLPVIARQGDCQTCFMCEAHCPADALYVAPFSGPAPAGSRHTDEAALAGAFGEYRRVVGWGRGRTPGSRADRNHIFTERLRSSRRDP